MCRAGGRYIGPGTRIQCTDTARRRGLVLTFNKAGEVKVFNWVVLIAVLLVLRVKDRRFELLLLRVLSFTITITTLIRVGARTFLRLTNLRFLFNRNNFLKIFLLKNLKLRVEKIIIVSYSYVHYTDCMLKFEGHLEEKRV